MRKYSAKRKEASIEESMRKRVLKESGVIMFRKNASASIYSDKSFPDRTLYAHFGFVMQVEAKRPGEMPAPNTSDDENQRKLHKGMRDAGHIVYCIDNTAELIAVYRKEYLQWLQEKARAGNKKAQAEFTRLYGLWLLPPTAKPPKSALASRAGSKVRVSTKSCPSRTASKRRSAASC
jgi:hypothetical protein